MDVLRLWGKTTPTGDFHPALFHMLDVGHVAQQLLTSPAPPRFRRVLAHSFEFLNPDGLFDWLPLAAALHDIGKLSSPFQRQSVEQLHRLEAEGFDLAPADYKYRHQLLSAAIVGDLTARFPGLAPVIPVLIDVFAGHHGTFAQSSALEDPTVFVHRAESMPMSAMRAQAIDQLATAFPLGSDLPGYLVNPRVATAVLTGFIILCDWLGSDAGLFAAESGLSLEAYRPLSLERALDAVVAAGFLSSRPEIRWSGFGSVFPDIRNSRPLQQAVDELSDEAAAWPSLQIIEAPTGEGKTEAALALAHRMAASGWSDEFYFALPTTATSNQMFTRVNEYLDRISDHQVGVKLIHGQAFLSEDSLRTRTYGNGADAESPAAVVPEWFAPKKRALLAPFGVGTVDQAELTVLSARHYMLRLFGLAGKVVIIDEVHAYDTYMNTIIDHALWWFASIGTSVILLSATLPLARHHEMARAYRHGLDGSFDVHARTVDDTLPYPVLASYTRGGSYISTPAASQPERTLQIEFVPDLSPGEEARRLVRLVESGGAICRITNTVGRAQEIYRSIRELGSVGIERFLLHARMPGDERLRREDAIAAKLGPDSTRTEADRIIVVGTQVLEQSLDLDFDLMISDHAPVDLLLQRAGRLHRHRWRERPAAFRAPVLQVVLSLGEEGAPRFGDSEFVYQPFVLWKSWLTLRDRQDDAGTCSLNLPADYRPLIEATYDHRRDVLPEAHPFRARLEAVWKAYQDEERSFKDMAKLRLIPDPEPDVLMTEGASLYFTEDEDGGSQGWGFAATRQGRESISVIPLHQVTGGVSLEPNGRPLAWATLGREEQLALARRALRLSGLTVVNSIRSEMSPELNQFRRFPMLRNYYPLVLEEREKEFDHVTLRLDPELGLEIRREGQP